MTQEIAVEPPPRAGLRAFLQREGRAEEADAPAKRRPVMIPLLFWTARVACVGYMMCYAYHIGI